ncbi:MAG: hypothetical protein PHS74_01295 [Lachnospiraceae bacterium]|nr:hypothetical protein [Lachnospiraceae bacterium]
MNNRRKIAIITVSAIICLTGCQTATIPDMTEEETSLVAQYAANIVLANNKNYDTGIATQEEIEKADAKLARQRQREAEAKEAEKKNEETSDTSTAGKSESVVTENADIAQFLGLSNVTITYQSYEICDSYPHDTSDDTFFAMDATAGNKLLVAKFTMQNHSTEDQDIDILYQYPLFRISVNGNDNNNALTTLLLDDLSTFKDTLTADESREVVLVTEIKEEESQEEVQSLDLHMRLNDQMASTKLQ